MSLNEPEHEQQTLVGTKPDSGMFYDQSCIGLDCALICNTISQYVLKVTIKENVYQNVRVCVFG